MKTILTSLALAATTVLVAAPVQAATNNLTFGSSSLVTGTAGQVGAVYRFSDVTTNVDLLLEITSLSAAGAVTNVDGNASFFDSSNDNLIVSLSRTQSSEEDTFTGLKFTFVDAGTSDITVVNDVILTFGDIDSHDNLAFSDYVQLDPTQFSSIQVGADLTTQFIGAEERYIYSFPANPNIPNTDPSQIDVSVILGLDSASTFEMTWGYFGAGAFSDRGMLLDGSNELAANPIPEPASAALLGLGGLALLARRRR